VQAQVARTGVLRAGVPFDLAARASNLAERIRIVEALSPADRAAAAGAQLTNLDAWRLRRLAGRLARDRRGARTTSATPWSAEELEDVLATHRR